MGLPRFAFALSLVTVLFALDNVYTEEDSSRHLSESCRPRRAATPRARCCSLDHASSAGRPPTPRPRTTSRFRAATSAPCWVDGRSKGLFIAWIVILIGGICCTVVVGIASEGRPFPSWPRSAAASSFERLVIAWRVTAGADDDDDDSYSSSSDYDSSSYDTTSAPTTAWSSSDTSSSSDYSSPSAAPPFGEDDSVPYWIIAPRPLGGRPCYSDSTTHTLFALWVSTARLHWDHHHLRRHRDFGVSDGDAGGDAVRLVRLRVRLCCASCSPHRPHDRLARLDGRRVRCVRRRAPRPDVADTSVRVASSRVGLVRHRVFAAAAGAPAGAMMLVRLATPCSAAKFRSRWPRRHARDGDDERLSQALRSAAAIGFGAGVLRAAPARSATMTRAASRRRRPGAWRTASAAPAPSPRRLVRRDWRQRQAFGPSRAAAARRPRRAGARALWPPGRHALAAAKRSSGRRRVVTPIRVHARAKR